MSPTKTLRFAGLIVTLMFARHACGSVLFVDANASPNGDGLSWPSAYRFLQDALANSQPGSGVTEVRVAQGVYRADCDESHPNGTGLREATFQLISGVALLGGWAGPKNPNVRDIELYPTILSGDLLMNDGPDFANYSDNSYNVVAAIGVDALCLIEGFVITSGNGSLGCCPQTFAGAGVHLNGASLTIRNCLFTANAAGGGGAMYIDNSASPSVEACTFTWNKSSSVGGAVWSKVGSATFTDCVFEHNAAQTGGAVHSTIGNLVFQNCHFTLNKALHPTANGGGGIYLGTSSITALVGCSFEQNTSNAFGGAVHCADQIQRADLTATGCTFLNNEAADSGGAIGGIGDNFINIVSCTFEDNGATEEGGAIFSQGPLVVDTCVFLNNSTAGKGGFSGGGAIRASEGTFQNSLFSGNSGSRGGAIRLFAGPFTITDCTFDKNSAAFGGAILDGAFHQNTPHISGCLFISNVAQERGGAVVIGSTTGAYEDCVFESNHANQMGGAISCTGSSQHQLKLTNCQFDANSAGIDGGAIYNDQTTFGSVSQCTFHENTAVGDGGAIRNTGGKPVINECEFLSNSAGSEGGAAYNSGGSAVYQNCTFQENSAVANGGALLASAGTTVVLQSQLLANEAQLGGGVYLTSFASGLRVERSLFQGNIALDGAGLYNQSSGSSGIVSCLFNGNSATHDGGAILSKASGQVVANCTVTSNTAANAGGGFIALNGINPLRDSIFWNNASSSGTALQAQITSVAPAIVSLAGCCIQNLPDGFGGGNINANPQFTNLAGPDGIAGSEDDDLHLVAASPCVDAAVSAPQCGSLHFDLDGQPRTADSDENGTIVTDIGAYERLGQVSPLGDLDCDGTVGVDDLMIVVNAWGTCPAGLACPGDFDANGVVNVDDLIAVIINWG